MRRSQVAYISGACIAARTIAMSVEGCIPWSRHGKGDGAGPAAGCSQGAG